ncbi:MAG: tetratricopeptide repeat protein [Gammaproteobacteria bacterium]|nr:tetratricopeptide repeat protein [Gammaproteobacteria bacterium]
MHNLFKPSRVAPSIGLIIFLMLSSVWVLAQSVKPYHESDYQLAFSVFVASGELQDAWTIADEAVAQRPQDLIWRRRLAQVSEWLQKPEVAYRQWHFLFNNNQRDQQVMSAIRRLALPMGDQAMALQLWLMDHRLTSLTDLELIELSDLFEANNQSKEGAERLLALYQRNHNGNYLAAAARLYYRQGQLSEALELFSQLLTLPRLKSAWVMNAAIIYVHLGNQAQAVEIMSTNSGKLMDAKADYWALLGEMAWYQQKNKIVAMAYERLAKFQSLSGLEQARLFNVLLTDYPEQASEYAFLVFQQTQDSQYLARALAFAAENQDWLTFGRQLKQISPQLVTQLESNPNFLLLRAQYYLQSNQQELADSDMAKVQFLAPNNLQVAVQVIWYYLDRDKIDMLYQAVKNYHNLAQNQPELWPPLAVAFHRLHYMPLAIDYYQKLLSPSADPLMLLNYADALTLTNANFQAERIRTYVWQRLNVKKTSAQKGNAMSRAEKFAFSGLSLRNDKGDRANYQIRKMIQTLNTQATKDDEYQRKSLVVSWALETGQLSALKLWISANYENKKISPPDWAQASIALQLNDSRLLSQMYQNRQLFAKLMPDVQHDIAQALNISDHASAIAFKTLERNPRNEGVHERLVNRVVETASQVGVQAGINARDRQQFGSTQFFAKLRLVPNWYVDIEQAQSAVSNDKDSLYTVNVKDMRLLGIGLHHSDSKRQWGVMLHQHQRLVDWSSLRLTFNQNIGRDWQANSLLSYQTATAESTAMSLAARESLIQLGFAYQLMPSDSVRLSVGFADYQTQLSERLGSGVRVDWELAHQIFYSSPDWNLRIAGAHRRYQVDSITQIKEQTMSIFSDPNTANRASSFMPIDTDLYSACFGWGQKFAQRQNIDGSTIPALIYTKSLRTIAEICVTHNTSAQIFGFSGMLGARGSIDGEDQWLALYQESNGGIQLSDQTLRSFSVQYQRLF